MLKKNYSSGQLNGERTPEGEPVVSYLNVSVLQKQYIKCMGPKHYRWSFKLYTYAQYPNDQHFALIWIILVKRNRLFTETNSKLRHTKLNIYLERQWNMLVLQYSTRISHKRPKFCVSYGDWRYDRKTIYGKRKETLVQQFRSSHTSS